MCVSRLSLIHYAAPTTSAFSILVFYYPNQEGLTLFSYVYPIPSQNTGSPFPWTYCFNALSIFGFLLCFSSSYRNSLHLPESQVRRFHKCLWHFSFTHFFIYYENQIHQLPSQNILVFSCRFHPQGGRSLPRAEFKATSFPSSWSLNHQWKILGTKIISLTCIFLSKFPYLGVIIRYSCKEKSCSFTCSPYIKSYQQILPCSLQLMVHVSHP